MNDLDTIARHHAEQARAAVADARLPRLDIGRSRRVWRETRPAWAAVIGAATVVLVLGLLRLPGGLEGDDDVAATTVPTSTVIVGPEGGFVPTGSMTGRCAWCNAVLLDDGRVLIVGGVDEEGPIAEIYDPATWTFTPTGRPPYSYPEITDAVLLDDGRVLVVGLSLSDNAVGIGPSNAALYDPASGSFQSIDWPEGKGSAAVGLADGRVLVVGGQTRRDRITAALFDPRLDRFTATGLPNVSWGFPVTATLLDDGRVLVVGAEPSGMAEIYDPQTGTFTLTGSLSTARAGPTATRLVDGRVLIVGGGGEGSAALASAEIYDPDTGTFTPTGPMATARWGHAVAPLPDGRVLVVGGGGRVLVGGSDDAGDPSVEATAEIYDPLTGRFTQAPAPTTSRLAATAVSLTDGRVLVLGYYPGTVSGLGAVSKS
ncbi:MAG TPA: kelch repeat-containing protein, partial [Acidimicrobiia bacterium]